MANIQNKPASNVPFVINQPLQILYQILNPQQPSQPKQNIIVKLKSQRQRLCTSQESTACMNINDVKVIKKKVNK